MPAWELWCEVQTQWRVGMGGATGLDYAAVLAIMRHAKGWRRKKRAAMLELLRACEAAQLEVWGEQIEKDKPAS